jgi:hypothetical protein
VVGSNCTFRVTACVGFRAIGNVAPEIVKPVPLSVAEAIVTGSVPVEVKVTGSVDAVFTVTLPNATPAGLTVNVGTAALSCRAKLLETLPTLAVSVTACAVETDATVAVKPPLLVLAGTTTVAGTVTAALLLAKATLKPPLPAAALNVTVHASVPAPANDALVQESALSAAGTAVPVPVRPTTAVPLVDELLWIVS